MSEPLKKKSGGKCPICGKPSLATHVPFCSKRCKQIDLANWLGEAYRIPASHEDEDHPSQEDD